MAGKIPDETIQAIRDRVSIVEVISGYVTLKKAGRNYVGLCPFHTEKTPSFTVSEERGLFHCFGCGAGGTIFTFVMRIERQEFLEAAENLARRAGIPLPERRESSAATQRREELLHLNDLAAVFFRQGLQRREGQRARSYLSERAVSPDTAEKYGLGFAPASGAALAQALAREKVPVTLAVELGLLARAGDGRVYDRFRNRLMFPIRHINGRVIGFGGRILDGEGPKYLNSPESALFRKGENLYGLYEARSAIREVDCAVLVEGYLDSLALVQAGIGYTVATLGTALTVAQLRLVRRFSEKVIVFFDGDPAGQKAAERAFAISAEASVWAQGAFLPLGFDPDSFVRRNGAAATQQLLSAATPLADFYLDRMDPGPKAGVPERARAAAEVAGVLARIRDPFEYDLLVRQAAQRFGVREQTLRQAAAARPAVPAGASPQASGTKVAVLPEEEALLVEVMGLDRKVATWAEQHGVIARFRAPDLAAAANLIVRAWSEGPGPASVVDSLPVVIATRLTASLVGEGPMASADRMKVAQDCVARIQRRYRREVAGDLNAELRRAEQQGDGARSREKLLQRNRLLRQEGGGAR